MKVLVLLVIAGVAYSQNFYSVHEPHFARTPIVGVNLPIFSKPKPYHFGYGLNDAHGTDRHRQESGDEHGNKKGSYGYKDAHGIYRQVDYIADAHGFRAVVRTNEPGTANQDPAFVKMVANPQLVVAHTANKGYGLGSHNLYGMNSLAHIPPAIFTPAVSHGMHQPLINPGIMVPVPFVHYSPVH